MRWTNAGVLLSIGLHGGVAAWVAFLPKPTTSHSSMVAVVDHKKKDEKKEDKVKVEEPPPPPPKPVTAPRPLPKANPPPAAPPPPAAAAPPPRPAAAAALAAMPDLGISMSGGSGPGVAVPQPQTAATQPTSKAADAPKAAAPKPADDCTEEAVKPKPLGAAAPAYTEAARSAGVEGRVRVQLTVGESGSVSAASILSGLGYGLDEAALSAAKRMKFTPGSRCGRPAASRFVVSMRFALE